MPEPCAAGIPSFYGGADARHFAAVPGVAAGADGAALDEAESPLAAFDSDLAPESVLASAPAFFSTDEDSEVELPAVDELLLDA